MQSTTFRPRTPDGWQLELTRFVDAKRRDPNRRPVLFIPGYGMNAFILSHHPSDVSIVGHLVAQGAEVWTANLRGQGGARRGPSAKSRYGFAELALIDLPCAMDEVLRLSDATHLDLIGCSLGATVAYAYLAHNPYTHPLGAFVSIGGPLRWVRVHPLVRAAFSSPKLASALPISGTRAMARAALPLARRAPKLVSLYLNVDNIDLSAPEELVRTVDDPTPHLNGQIARWVRARDLVVDGVDITRAVSQVEAIPMLCVAANRDGVVPLETALSGLDHIGSRDTRALIAGDERAWYAHADMFIARDARERVFTPLAAWLASKAG
jgi:alpha-beta hydrolase superfamily lysophospholipase